MKTDKNCIENGHVWEAKKSLGSMVRIGRDWRNVLALRVTVFLLQLLVMLSVQFFKSAASQSHVSAVAAQYSEGLSATD